MAEIAHSSKVLRSRIDRFLLEGQRAEIQRFINTLLPYGEVALFGGMLRDICFGGIDWFSSDVDIVIRTGLKEQIIGMVRSNYHVERNSFGGYRVFLEKWRSDFWFLEDTWAFKSGFVVPPTFPSLLKTTFFDWDAILYIVNMGTLLTRDGYYKTLESGVVDINLQENPNVTGALMRSFRLFEKYNATPGEKLRRYIIERMPSVGVEDIVSAERKSYQNPMLSFPSVNRMLAAIVDGSDVRSVIQFELPMNSMRP